MEINYEHGDYVDNSKKKKMNERKKNVLINNMQHELRLLEYKDGFDIILKSPRSNYYLQINPKKNFKGFSKKKSLFSRYRSYQTESTEVKVFNTSQNSLLQLFKDTFFTKKTYSKFEFLFQKKEDVQRYGRRKELVSTNRKKKRKVNIETDLLYLRIDIIPKPDHLINKYSYFFTFLTMPSIDVIDLPDEMLLEIFQFLKTDFLLIKVNSVCKRFHNLVESEFICRIFFFRMFPESKKKQKPNPEKSWKENMEEKFRNSIKWVNVGDDGFDKPVIERVDGSPTHCKFYPGDFDFYATNCYVSSTDSNEWKIQLKYPPSYLTGVAFERIGLIPKSGSGSSEYLGHESGYGLNLGNGSIKHNDDHLSYTHGGWSPRYNRYGGYDEYDESEYEDNGLIKETDDFEVTMKLSKGELSFVYGKKKHEVGCVVSKGVYSLCFNPNKEVEANILSFKKL